MNRVNIQWILLSLPKTDLVQKNDLRNAFLTGALLFY